MGERKSEGRPREVKCVACSPEVHNKIGDFEREVASDVVEDIVVAGMIASHNTPLLLHGMVEGDWFKGHRVQSNSFSVIDFLRDRM